MKLPNELMIEALQYLDKVDLKSARLVSKLWSICASEHLFAKLFISPHQLNLEVFTSIAQDPMLSRCVKELEYDAVQFGPDLTTSEYIEMLWQQSFFDIQQQQRTETTSTLGSGFKTPDLQVRHFVKLREACQPWSSDSQAAMEEAQVQCYDFAFIQEGYRKWMDQAAFEKKCCRENTLRKLLIANLGNFRLLRNVKLRDEWPSRETFGGKGSPLARSWNCLHTRPECWAFHSDHMRETDRACSDFWFLTFALSTAGRSTIRSLSIEGVLLRSAFIIPPDYLYQDHGVAAYFRLEYLKVTLVRSWLDEPEVEFDDSLHALQFMLNCMKALKRFELDLPDDLYTQPPNYSPYTLVFPENGHWPQLATLTLRNLAIGTNDLINLLRFKMPNLNHLSIGNINLLDGHWESIFEYMRVARVLPSFKILAEFDLLHDGGQNYLGQPPGSDDQLNDLAEYEAFARVIELYVMGESDDLSMIYPVVIPRQPAQQLNKCVLQ